MERTRLHDHQEMRLFKQRKYIVPCCGELVDASMGVGQADSAPGPGTFMVCAFCYSILRFDEAMRMRMVPFDQIPPELLKVQQEYLSTVTRH